VILCYINLHFSLKVRRVMAFGTSRIRTDGVGMETSCCEDGEVIEEKKLSA